MNLMTISSGRVAWPVIGLVLGILGGAPFTATAHEDGGDPQTVDQQKCTNAANASWVKLSKVVNKTVESCLKHYASSQPLTPNPGVTTLEQCVHFDATGKLQKQKVKTSDAFDNSCGGPDRSGVDKNGFPQLPPYGVTTPARVNAAAEQLELDLVHDLFGDDLDAGGVVKMSDPGDASDAAKCQQAVVKRVEKCLQARQKQFLTCTKTHLKSGGIYGLIYDVGDLALCYDGMAPDKLAKACGAIPGGGLEKDVAGKCAAKVEDRTLSQLFPGCATNDVPATTTCLDERVRCRFCLSVNAADDAQRDCDAFDDGDDANNSCLPCGAAQGFDSTFEAIQELIFDAPVYGCSSNLCHGSFAPQGNLDLSAGSSYASLVGTDSFGASPPMKRVEPGEPALSFLYNKLAAATIPGHDAGGGSPMPSGGAPALTPEHLEAIQLWIRGGAPETLSVDGTALLLGSCLPEPDPLTIPVPDPPGAGVGVQLRQTPWSLPAESENEICMATYYDLTATALVPASAKVPCPPHFLPPSMGGTDVNNPSGECFAYRRTTLYQDPQSHHSILHTYIGQYDTSDPGWGSWTYKFQDQMDPLEGTSCVPTNVDPATGYNPGCSGAVETAVACLGYGPPDYSFGAGLGFGGGTAPMFGGSQEPFFQQEYPGGVYNLLPMQGVVVWNSHAFNLTSGNTTMSQYLNLDFAGPADQVYPVLGIFDSASIFVQDVPPFETREYCRTYTIPASAQLFELSSHTHRHGVRFRIWAPPNASCVPGEPACVPRGDTPMYLSTEYSDPLQLVFDPPIAHGTGNTAPAVAARTYLYCSLYDNGAGPGSPSVKRQSTSPEPPVQLPFGGPCETSELQCIGGPNQGTDCFGIQSYCDSFPGAADGDCDACPVRGGVTTEDEMYIMLGAFYVPTP